MTSAEGPPSASIVAVSRAVVAAAAELVAGVERAVVGDDKVRTAQRNAWDALQADRARAEARDEMNRVVAALLAGEPRRDRGGLPGRHPNAAPSGLFTSGARVR